MRLFKTPPNTNTVFVLLSLWLFFAIAPPFLGAVSQKERGLFYYVVDRSGSIASYGLTEPIRRAITEHASQLPEDTDVRLVFFSRQASEPHRWEVMTPAAKADFSAYFAKNFIPDGPTRLYDTVGEVMEELRATEEDYRFVSVLIFSDGENNWSRKFRRWTDLEPVYRQLAKRHEVSFIYWITLEFDPAEEPPSWVLHMPQAPGTTDIPIPEPPPLADFAAYPSQLKVGEQIQFEYLAKGGRAEAFAWDFGDGNVSSERNPQHEYERDGSYTVTLRTKGPGGEATEVKADHVQVAAVIPLAAQFRSPPERIRIGDTLQLQDQSEGNPEEWEWSVNGEAFSAEANASFTFEDPGEMSISLTVKRGRETDSAIQSVTVLPPPPPAAFEIRPAEAGFGDTVVFAAQKTRDDWQHAWTIDGEVSLEGATVEWVSDRHGLMRVIHGVEGPGGFSRQSESIFIHPPVAFMPSTGFSVSPRVFTEGDAVTFRAEETGEGWEHEWLVDGERLGEGPEWQWNSDQVGNLSVTHRVRIPDTDAVFEKSDEVLGRDHELVQVQFSASLASGRYPMEVQFKDESVGRGVAYHWDFGDGNVSNQRNPTHVYREAGDFGVVLTVTNPRGQVTSNVEPVVLAVIPPMPLWQQVSIGFLAALAVWVVVIVPLVLRPMLAPQRGPKLVGIRTYPLHLPARRRWSRFLWPRHAVTVGTSFGSDIRLPNGNGCRGNVALIERAPAASSYRIRPVKRNDIFKIEKHTSLMSRETEGKSKVIRPRMLKDGDTYEIAGERLTWCQPKKPSARKKSRNKKKPLTKVKN